MPIDTTLRPRMTATIPACSAVIAARLHAPAHERTLLRRLRVHHFSGDLIDEPRTIAAAALEAGIDPVSCGVDRPSAEVDRGARRGHGRAREPMSAARVLDGKLANWSGGRRYTCPSYEICRVSDGVRIAVPGFQPFAAYDVVLANLVPGTERREPPASVEEVLGWTATPLATQGGRGRLRHHRARRRASALGHVADERHVGFDGFWTLPGA